MRLIHATARRGSPALAAPVGGAAGLGAAKAPSAFPLLVRLLAPGGFEEVSTRFASDIALLFSSRAVAWPRRSRSSAHATSGASCRAFVPKRSARCEAARVRGFRDPWTGDCVASRAHVQRAQTQERRQTTTILPRGSKPAPCAFIQRSHMQRPSACAPVFGLHLFVHARLFAVSCSGFASSHAGPPCRAWCTGRFRTSCAQLKKIQYLVWRCAVKWYKSMCHMMWRVPKSCDNGVVG